MAVMASRDDDGYEEVTWTTGATSDPPLLPHCPVPPFSQLAIKPDLLLRLRWRCCRMDGCSTPPTAPHPPPEGLRPAPLTEAPPTSGEPPPSKLRIVEKFASGSSGGGARLVGLLGLTRVSPLGCLIPPWCSWVWAPAEICTRTEQLSSWTEKLALHVAARQCLVFMPCGWCDCLTKEFLHWTKIRPKVHLQKRSKSLTPQKRFLSTLVWSFVMPWLGVSSPSPASPAWV